MSGDISIAYQVVGDGPLDLVVVPGWISHLDMQWDVIGFPQWVERLARFARVILFDKRGIGVSDRDVSDSTLEERADDLRAVMDAVGSERAAVYGLSEGGSLAMLFAASRPERVQSLVLSGTAACVVPAPDFPAGRIQADRLLRLRELTEHHWGTGETLEMLAPSLYPIDAAREFMGRFERAAASPRAARAAVQWLLDIDVRPVAQALHVPTLVQHRDDDATVAVECGRWLGQNIPGAEYREYPSREHQPWIGDFEREVDDIQHFLTGSRGEIEGDRFLATILFTDIVGATEKAAALGDRSWRELLARHHALVRSELRRFRGTEQDAAGDGFFAAFDGPARAVRCAMAVRDAVRPLGLEVRAGVHIGECERVDDKLAGIAVHTGARVMAKAEPSEVLVSSTVKDLVAGSGLAFRERGTHELKGVPGEWQLYAVG